MPQGPHEQTVRRTVGALNAGDIEAYLDLYHEDADGLYFVGPNLPHTKQGARIFYGAFFAAFPDLHVDLTSIVENEDKVAAVYRITGTQNGEFMGAPASGRKIDIEGLTLLHMRDGRCVERWARIDDIALMQQLGLMPAA